MDDDELKDRVRRLERRLDQYHYALETCLDHDRQFQLKATWGIVNGVVGLGAYVVVYYALSYWLDDWVLGLIAGFAGFIAFAFAFAWSDKGREGDEKKLSRLPRWRDDS